MSTTSDIITSSSVDAYGNSYTSAISGNDKLYSEDFITLMLTELSMQDPTEPADASTMLDNQLQIQTLETNISLSESMETLTSSYEQSALADSVSLIGNIVETGEYDDSGNLKQYKVSAVEGQDGTVSLTAYQLTDYYDIYSFEEIEDTNTLVDSSSEDDVLSITDNEGNVNEISTYGKTYEELSSEINALSGISSSLVATTNGTYQLTISVSGGGSSLSSNGVDFAYNKENATAYNSEAETLQFSSITKIY